MALKDLAKNELQKYYSNRLHIFIYRWSDYFVYHIQLIVKHKLFALILSMFWTMYCSLNVLTWRSYKFLTYIKWDVIKPRGKILFEYRPKCWNLLTISKSKLTWSTNIQLNLHSLYIIYCSSLLSAQKLMNK